MSTGFSSFHAAWRDLIRVKTSAEHTRDLYFQTDRDARGFDLLPDFFACHGEEWAVTVTTLFEQGSALANRLDGAALEKFRMIQDRHLINVMKADFGDAYHSTCDERSLFLIHAQVPPVRVSSAFARAKNAAFDLLVQYQDDANRDSDLAVMSAMSTIFILETHHTLRAYVYFERYNSDAEAHFEVVRAADSQARDDYTAPTANKQMSMPDKSRHGTVEMF